MFARHTCVVPITFYVCIHVHWSTKVLLRCGLVASHCSFGAFLQLIKDWMLRIACRCTRVGCMGWDKGRKLGVNKDWLLASVESEICYQIQDITLTHTKTIWKLLTNLTYLRRPDTYIYTSWMCIPWGCGPPSIQIGAPVPHMFTSGHVSGKTPPA